MVNKCCGEGISRANRVYNGDGKPGMLVGSAIRNDQAPGIATRDADELQSVGLPQPLRRSLFIIVRKAQHFHYARKLGVVQLHHICEFYRLRYNFGREKSLAKIRVENL